MAGNKISVAIFILAWIFNGPFNETQKTNQFTEIKNHWPI